MLEGERISASQLCNRVQIINWGPPGSLQMYFQMVGRGGRDMLPARCLLVWSRANVATKRFLQRQDAAQCAPPSLARTRPRRRWQRILRPRAACVKDLLARSAVNGSSCRGAASSTDAADFDGVMKYIEEPIGCRQAQIAGTFAGTAPRGNAALASLCQGGCDVCDLRFAALRDMSAAARRVLIAVEFEGALARAALIERCLVRGSRVPGVCPLLTRPCMPSNAPGVAAVCANRCASALESTSGSRQTHRQSLACRRAPLSGWSSRARWRAWVS